MSNGEATHTHCAYCGRPKSAIVFHDSDYMRRDGILICAGWCTIGYEVDLTHSDNWE